MSVQAKAVGDYLVELRDALRVSGHEHGTPCRVCDDLRAEKELAFVTTSPVCHRCEVEHPRAPTCPCCGASHYATREGDHWHCCYCNTVFHGSTDEWANEGNQARREAFAESRARFLRLYDERYNTTAVGLEA